MSHSPIASAQNQPESVARPSARASRWRPGGDAAGLALAATLVIVTSANNGSYFSSSWGWEALALLALGLTGLCFMVTVRVFLLQALCLAAIVAFVIWVGLSALWSESVSGSVREVERDIVYVGLVFALTIFGRYFSGRGLAYGVLVGITSVSGYALTTRLFPTHFSPPDPTFSYQLSVPLGYWNALGLLSAMGMILAFGVAAHGNTRLMRILAGAATCVIVPTMLFTFSRGAWGAAAAGLVVMVTLDTRRVELVAALAALVGPVGVLVWLGVTSTALTSTGATVAQATQAGRRYAVAVILLACSAAVLTDLAHRWIVRAAPGRTAERRLTIGIIVATLVAAVATAMALGGPVRAADRGWSAFNGQYAVPSDNLRDRFGSLSNNGRVEHWRVAVATYRDHWIFGAGAGTYEQEWYLQRTIDLTARDAHSLYLEVLAELGPIGLLALLCAFAVPAVGLVRSRSEACVPAAAGAFAAFALHAGIDWDWEMVCLTVTAILVGTVGLVTAGSGTRELVLGPFSRVVLAAAAVAAAAFAFVSYAGNKDLAASRASLSAGNPARAANEARRASRLLRWSVEPWIALGDAQRAGNDVSGARASYVRAAEKDTGNWRVWAALVNVTSGASRRAAIKNVRTLNPGYDPTTE